MKLAKLAKLTCSTGVPSENGGVRLTLTVLALFGLTIKLISPD